MSRAVSQNIAWISAFVLSSLVLAGVLGLVFAVAPQKSSAGAHGHDAPESGSGHGEHAAPSDEHGGSHKEAHDKAAPEHPASEQHGAEEEISAASFKKNEAGAHSDDSHEKPHH